ncbi:putative hotdog family 3-hydroxylacyl-ACP dehydratase [Povalibacter uvarum]|uniref:Putative hotdog family 3-hydroxylacyl-ACP dehydratase n=1 Tax=Povalibacter uvarum TaxID=732238 RepID=A0A841HM77_9GAMM|nr:hydroxymyristoyl-ACP dehydratase [Povalibacter uvarum]MBB6093380.1 putative hotdog family 3-hydroxylacyl-ACP dehydratase [Povalibacter uvarum]
MSTESEIGRERLEQLVPHAGSMCLLDRVLSHASDRIVCVADNHRDAAHPLRHGGRLAALHLAEYAAQATAVHGALVGTGTARPGMLAALRDLRLFIDRIDTLDTPLMITARRQLSQASGSLYEFEVRAGDRLLCQGRVAIALG